MLRAALPFVECAPHIALAPGAAILIAAISVSAGAGASAASWILGGVSAARRSRGCRGPATP